MLKTLVNLLKKIFPGNDPHYCMEQFLLSKNIKTAGDIEHWQRQYETHQHKGWL
jgi:hypothetical protein